MRDPEWQRPSGLTVRTSGSHPGNRGSIPLEVTESDSALPKRREPSLTWPFLYNLRKRSLTSLNLKMNSTFHYVYILFSLKDKQLYAGYSDNLNIRINDHFKGKVRATRNRLPLVLIHYEAFSDQKDAKAREKFLKSGFGRNQLKEALKNKLKELGYKYLKE